MKLIHLKDVGATGNEPARLVNSARLAELAQVSGLVKRDLLLELITAQSVGIRRAFDSEIPTVATDAHPNGTTVTTADIALPDVAATDGLTLIVIALDKELAFDLERGGMGRHQATMKME